MNIKLIGGASGAKYIVIALILAAAAWYYLNEKNKMMDQIIYWQNQVAKERGVVELTETMYEAEVIRSRNLKIANEELSKRVDQADGKITQYGRLLLSYQTRIDSISTIASTRDTTIIYADNPVKSRVFSKQRDELFVTGWFQTESPYLLTIDSLSIDIDLDFIFWRDEFKVWKYTMDTKSKYVKARDISINFTEDPHPWNWFYGGNINLSWNELKLDYISALLGIKHGDYGINGQVGWHPVFGASVGAGFIKFMDF